MNIKLLIQGLALTTVLVSSHLASAASFNLCTGVTTLTMPDATTIEMWGYGLDDSSPTCTTASIPGPRLTVPDGDIVLTINLRNTLAVPTSIMVPGLSASTYLAPTFFTDSQGRSRARAMTQEAAASGGTQTYNFTTSPGTYLYQSGSHPAVQVQMGLYGAVTNNTLLGEAYPNVTYDNEVVLLYSEIDPALHSAVADLTYGTLVYPSTINYVPKYFLVNGAPYTGSTLDISAGTTGQTTLLRFLNAGLESHIPVLQGGHMDVIAEYGSPYPYQRKQSSLLLAAGQSKDALFTADTAGRYALYDRRLRLTNNMQAQGGLMSFLNVTAAAGAPVAVPDSGTTDEDTVNASLNLAGNDTDNGTIDVTSIYIPFQPANGAVITNGDGTVTYTPNANFNGADTFSYVINDDLGNTSAPADVTITVNPVNDAPIAIDESYVVDASTTFSVTSPGVLDNDTDVDLDTLTAILQTDVTGGTLSLSPDGSFSYTPAMNTATDSFTYIASDSALENSNIATVTITINAILPPPAAVLISPSGSIGANSTPTYTWNAVANDTDYLLWVVDVATGTPFPAQWYTAATAGCGAGQATCAITVPASLTPAQYRWTILTRNAAGNGSWSTPMLFSTGLGALPSAATLSAPVGSIGANDTPTYSWNAVTNDTDYLLWVVDVATGTPLPAQWYTAATAGCGAGQATCAITAPTPLAPAQYRWTILTRNAAGNGPWSTSLLFSTGLGNPPPATTLISPSGSIGANSTPTYTWNAVANNTDYLLWVVDVATGTPFPAQWYTAATAGCGAGQATCAITAPTPLAPAQYRWTILTRNAAGNGSWSTPMLFSTGTPPVATTIFAPVGNIVINTPSYSWSAIANDTDYLLWVVDVATGTPLPAQWYTAAAAGCGTGQATCAITAPTPLAPAQYRWMVKTRSAVGNGPWSNVLIFNLQ